MNEDPAFSYPVAERALNKWCRNQLIRDSNAEGDEHFQFSYLGSTCNNGGTPFTAILHAVISNNVIKQAWIEIPETEQKAAALMCRPLESPMEQPDFVGRKLESLIMEDMPQNFAGCFCGPPHINQKWKMALSAMHYALS
jgi:hypothetical protein